ncbi:Methyltransferase domain-containing protein [Kitasatospora sp. MMS16-BH015]|uniref:class I SAM-dependent methyltransferase n=1 Tax=Kitasatospora sp. MMS16-BH015 TaxID=2018025 RepID=UPI000CA0B897|nr:class I SAM-dependent methyltransferase [Kitasatospora sp. MMS16-BH015]AUG75232.1 Methyltransferase domain-containing protein [Kitasatospora sp. MMS16-BH015]
MGITTTVRRRLGKYEIPAAELYRSVFIDLDSLTTTLLSLGRPGRILEIGCGDGAVAERLVGALPDAEYVGIDVMAAPGRLFRGDRARAEFRSVYSHDLRAEGPALFDLVLVVDVLHHVPPAQREALLRDAEALLAPGGTLIVKEWERRSDLAHLMAYTADRYLSGDRNVDFGDRAELLTTISCALPELSVVCEARVPPNRSNILFALRRART